MPKVSFVQALTEMESVLSVTRANAGQLPPLAQQVADELEGYIAEFKAAKAQQEDLLARRIAATAELAAIIAQGNLAARKLRGYVVLALGTKHPLLSLFGIGIRGRRRRRSRSRSALAARASAARRKPIEPAAEPFAGTPAALQAGTEGA
jgi:hypothetical protein